MLGSDCEEFALVRMWDDNNRILDCSDLSKGILGIIINLQNAHTSQPRTQSGSIYGEISFYINFRIMVLLIMKYICIVPIKLGFGISTAARDEDQ